MFGKDKEKRFNKEILHLSGRIDNKAGKTDMETKLLQLAKITLPKAKFKFGDAVRVDESYIKAISFVEVEKIYTGIVTKSWLDIDDFSHRYIVVDDLGDSHTLSEEKIELIKK